MWGRNESSIILLLAQKFIGVVAIVEPALHIVLARERVPRGLPGANIGRRLYVVKDGRVIERCTERSDEAGRKS